MHDFCAIDNDEILLKKWHNGRFITLYIKIEDSMMSQINETKKFDYVKTINHMKKFLPKKGEYI